MAETGRESDDQQATGDGSPGVRPYDFRRPYKAQVRRSAALEPLHATFAAKCAAALSQHLRCDVVVSLTHVEQLRYDEFLYSIGPATCLSVLRVDPPGAQAILDLSPGVIQPMIVRLLGGSPASSAAPPSPQHVMTEIEKGLALQIIERTARQLADTWSGGAGANEIAVREESLETDPAIVRIMPGEELVTALRFDVRLGQAGGTMSLCLSDPIVAELDPTTAPAGRSTELQRQDLRKSILESAVELRALLAETKVRLSDVLDMQVGDVITTDKPTGDEVQVQIEGKDKLSASAAQLHGNRVVQISRLPLPDPTDSTLPGGPERQRLAAPFIDDDATGAPTRTAPPGARAPGGREADDAEQSGERTE
jgi:flagellar motor switch protein FliM